MRKKTILLTSGVGAACSKTDLEIVALEVLAQRVDGTIHPILLSIAFVIINLGIHITAEEVQQAYKKDQADKSVAVLVNKVHHI